MLRIRVTTANAEITETELITAGRRGLQCTFEFNSAWDGLTKTAVVDGVVARDVILSGTTITVPWECVTDEHVPLKIGVYGENSDGAIVIPTVWANFGKILPSAIPSSVAPEDLTPSLVQQIREEADEALLLSRAVMQMAESGTFDGQDAHLPEGGTAGQVLTKQSALEDDVGWAYSHIFTPEMFGAAADGVTDDSAAVQAAIAAAATDDGVVAFPSASYSFKGITLPDNITLFLGRAAISAAAAKDWIFSAENGENIHIVGGVFSRPGTIQYSSDADLRASGVIKFDNCENVLIEHVTFNTNYTLNNVLCFDCRNVTIERCNADTYVGACFAFYNDCSDIRVCDCIIKNGLNKGNPYIYAVASGMTASGKRGITNYTVENCTVDYSDWEGIDCHGGRNIRFANNQIHNCYRWLTCYCQEYATVDTDTLGNAEIVNNVLTIDSPTKTFTYYSGGVESTRQRSDALILHGKEFADSETGDWKNIRFVGNTVIDPVVHDTYGIFSARRTRNLTIERNDILFTAPLSGKTRMIHLYHNFDAVIRGNRIIGHSATTVGGTGGKIVVLDRATAVIEDNAAYSHPSIATKPSYLVAGASSPWRHRYTLRNNVGDFAAIEATSTATYKLYADNEFVTSNTGYTGKRVSSNKPGLRALAVTGSDGSTYSGTIALGDTAKVTMTNAYQYCIPGQNITVTVGGTSYERVITEVRKSSFDLNLPVSDGSAEVSATITVGTFTSTDISSGGGSITVDSAISGSSENPVQNKVIKAALDLKGTYSKPSGGIPATDLATAVQNSLVFACTYGTTTSAEIDAAYQAGKDVIVTYNSKVYRLVYRGSSTSHTFAYFNDSSATTGQQVSCSSDTWSAATSHELIRAPSSPTTGDFLCWNGSAWAATSLSAWQGGSF